MKQCLVMQHVAFEDLGTFAPVLEEKGFAIRYCPVDEPPTEEEWLAADLAVVLGGAIGVYDQVLYPFLKDEKDLIRKRLESQKPLLGICLGAQLIASVLKSRVYPGKGKEIGWGGVELTEAGRKSPLRFLDGYRPVLHWHGDTFDLPEGAELLASTPVTPHQAFRMGNHVLALQFHPEVDADKLERVSVCRTGGTRLLSVNGHNGVQRRVARPHQPEQVLPQIGVAHAHLKRHLQVKDQIGMRGARDNAEVVDPQPPVQLPRGIQYQRVQPVGSGIVDRNGVHVDGRLDSVLQPELTLDAVYHVV